MLREVPFFLPIKHPVNAANDPLKEVDAGYSLIAGQGRALLNRVYNSIRACPKQGLNLFLTGYG